MHLGALTIALVLFAPLLATTASAQEYKAQQTAKVYRLGILDHAPSSRREAFRQELRGLGWVEGQNLTTEVRIGPNDHFPALAAQMVRLDVDVIFAPTTSAVEAVRSATKSIPIVFAVAADPVGSGFVKSLAQPGGNITGLTALSAELSLKHLELLRAIVPRMTRGAVLLNPRLPYSLGLLRELKAAAQPLGVQLQAAEWDNARDLVSALEAAKKQRAEALIVLPNPMNFPNQTRIAELALRYRLPSINPASGYAEAGGLMSYGANFVDLYRRAAVYVHKILKGAKAADLPVEQPTKFELIVSLKTAKTLGLIIPPSLMLQADRVIE